MPSTDCSVTLNNTSWVLSQLQRLWAKLGTLGHRDLREYSSVSAALKCTCMVSTAAGKTNLNFWQFEKGHSVYFTADKATGEYKSVERLKFN